MPACSKQPRMSATNSIIIIADRSNLLFSYLLNSIGLKLIMQEFMKNDFEYVYTHVKYIYIYIYIYMFFNEIQNS
jgi:hypothetical protein